MGARILRESRNMSSTALISVRRSLVSWRALMYSPLHRRLLCGTTNRILASSRKLIPQASLGMALLAQMRMNDYTTYCAPAEDKETDPAANAAEASKLVNMLTTLAMPIVTRLGAGGLAGFCTGYAM